MLCHRCRRRSLARVFEKAASLQALSLCVEANERIEDCQHMAPVFGDSFKSHSLFRLTQALTVPLGEHGGRNFNVAAQFLSRVTAEEQAVEESCLPLGKLEFAQRIINRVRQRRRT